MPDNRISAIAVADYTHESLVAAVGSHFDALGLWEELRPGMRVALKPNLLMRRAPEGGTTTHPAVVEAVAAVLRDHGITDLTLADSSGGPYTKPLLESIYAGTGMTAAAGRAGITLNTDTSWADHSCPDAALCKTFSLISPVTEADFVINLPKLKTHAMTTLSAGVKNLFGCIPGLQKPELHFRFPEKERFSRMLVDLALLVKPGITLVDAVDSMEGDGPSGGEVIRTGMTFCARNVHALDLGMCFYTALPKEQVLTVAHAIASGLCPAHAEGLAWLGEGRPEPRPFRPPGSKSLAFTGHVPKPLRRPLEWLEKKYLSPRPVVRRKDCIGCGKCAESCAPGAMTIRERKAVLEMGKCIRCYCCHEMCPVKAIDIRRMKLLGI